MTGPRLSEPSGAETGERRGPLGCIGCGLGFRVLGFRV